MVSPEAPLWLVDRQHLAASSHGLCPVCTYPWCCLVFLRGLQSYRIRAPPSRPQLKLIASFKVLSSIWSHWNLGVQHRNGGAGTTSWSLTPPKSGPVVLTNDLLPLLVRPTPTLSFPERCKDLGIFIVTSLFRHPRGAKKKKKKEHHNAACPVY